MAAGGSIYGSFRIGALLAPRAEALKFVSVKQLSIRDEALGQRSTADRRSHRVNYGISSRRYRSSSVGPVLMDIQFRRNGSAKRRPNDCLELFYRA